MEARLMEEAAPAGFNVTITYERLARLDPEANPLSNRETPAVREAAMYELGGALGLTPEDVDKRRARRDLTVTQMRTVFARVLRAQERAMLRADDQRRAEVEAERARELHHIHQERTLAERRANREFLTLGSRLDGVILALGMASTAPAAALSLAKVSTSKGGESKPPPPAELPNIEPRLNLIAFHIEALELELDAVQGMTDLSVLTSEQKDWLILHRFTGTHSRDLSRAIPELGSPRTIERVRSAAGQRPALGGPRSPRKKEAECSSGAQGSS